MNRSFVTGYDTVDYIRDLLELARPCTIRVGGMDMEVNDNTQVTYNGVVVWPLGKPSVDEEDD